MFYVYVMDLRAKPLSLPKFTILAFPGNAPKCIIHARNDETCMMGSGSQVWTQCDLTSTLEAFQYRTPGRREKEVDTQAAWGNQTIIGKPTREKTLMSPTNILHIAAAIYACLNSSSMWDGHLGSIKAVQHRIKLNKTNHRLIYSASYRAGPKQGNSKNKKLMGCSPWT